MPISIVLLGRKYLNYVAQNCYLHYKNGSYAVHRVIRLFNLFCVGVVDSGNHEILFLICGDAME